MNNQFKFQYIAILFLFALIACEKDADNAKLPPFEQKIVISAFISPSDTVSYVYVSSNRPVFGELNQSLTLTNPKAWITDGEKEIQLENAPMGFKFHRKNMQVIAGKTYTLKVNADNGLQAQASCTVPKSHSLSVTIDTFITATNYNGYISRSTKIKVSLKDFAGEKNFYRIMALFYNTYYIYEYPDNNKTLATSRQPILFEQNLANDLNKDGSDINFYSTNIFNNPDNTLNERNATCYILNTDKPYYDYHVSLKNYSDNDDPFTEVSPIYSNVQGGLGIFASYTLDSVVFKLK